MKNNSKNEIKPTNAQQLITYLTGKVIKKGSSGVHKMFASLGDTKLEKTDTVFKGAYDDINVDHNNTDGNHFLKAQAGDEIIPLDDFKKIIQCYDWGTYESKNTSKISKPVLQEKYQQGITDVLWKYPELSENFKEATPIIKMLEKLQKKECFSKIAKIEIQNDIKTLKEDTQNFRPNNNILERIIGQLKIIFREKKLGELESEKQEEQKTEQEKKYKAEAIDVKKFLDVYTLEKANDLKIKNIQTALALPQVQQMIQHSDLYLAAPAEDFKPSKPNDPAYSVPKGQVKAFLSSELKDVKELYLTGRPGSGKSMLFDYLTKQTPQNWFVIDQKMSLKTITALISNNKDANFILDEYDLLYADPEIKKLIDSITGKKIIATATPNKAFIVNKINELSDSIEPRLNYIAKIIAIANSKSPTKEQATAQATELKGYIDNLLVLAGNTKDPAQKHYINQIINLAEPLYTKVLIDAGLYINKDKQFAGKKIIEKMDTVFDESTKNIIIEDKSKSNLANVLQDCFNQETKSFCNILQMTTGFKKKDIQGALDSIKTEKKDFYLLVKKRGEQDVLYSINTQGSVSIAPNPSTQDIYEKNVLCISDYLRVNVDNKIGKVGTIYYDEKAPFECEALQSAYRNRVHKVGGGHTSAQIKFVNQAAKDNAEEQYNAFIEAEYNNAEVIMRSTTPTSKGSKGRSDNEGHNKETHKLGSAENTKSDKYMAVCTVCGFSCKDTHQIEGATGSDYLIVVDIKTGMPSAEHTDANTQEKLEKYIKMLDAYVSKQTNKNQNQKNPPMYSANSILNANKTSNTTQSKNIELDLSFLEGYKESINEYINSQGSKNNNVGNEVVKPAQDILPATEEKKVPYYGTNLQKLIDGILEEYQKEETKLQEQQAQLTKKNSFVDNLGLGDGKKGQGR